MRQINIYDCTECPWMEEVHCGTQEVCKQPQVQVKFPYAKDRKCSLTFMSKHCLLPEVTS